MRIQLQSAGPVFPEAAVFPKNHARKWGHISPFCKSVSIFLASLVVGQRDISRNKRCDPMVLTARDDNFISDVKALFTQSLAWLDILCCSCVQT